MEIRRLAIMRHSKAEGYDKPDIDRRLAPRGRRDGDAAGQWFAEHGFVPDAALVSAAARTRETWAAVALRAGWTVSPELSQPLYGAGPEAALDLVRLTSDDVGSLAVIGHNPTMAYLVQVLDDGTGDLGNELAAGFPTSALAVFELSGSWADLAPGACRLVGFATPRG